MSALPPEARAQPGGERDASAAGSRDAGAADPGPVENSPGDGFLASLMDTDLYSMGAYFSDRHPELVDEVLSQSEQIERDGLTVWAQGSGQSLQQSFQTLLTGLAVRYYKAVAG